MGAPATAARPTAIAAPVNHGAGNPNCAKTAPPAAATSKVSSNNIRGKDVQITFDRKVLSKLKLSDNTTLSITLVYKKNG